MKKKSIQKKFIVITIVSIFVMTTLMSAFHVYSDYNKDKKMGDKYLKLMKNSIVIKGKILSTDIAGYTENAIAAFNFFSISMTMEKLVKDTDNLEYGILVDDSGIVHVHTENPKLLDTKLDSRIDKFALQQIEFATIEYEKDGVTYLEFITPLKIGGFQWGYLRLGFSLVTIEMEIQNELLSMKKHFMTGFLTWVSITFVFAFVVSILISIATKRITTPLLQLAAVSEKIARGDFSAQIPENIKKADDETGELSRSFAHMTKKIEISRGLLKDYSSDLEKEIIVRRTTEEELKRSRDYFEKLNNSIADAVINVKLPGRVIEYVNNAAVNVFGYKPDECIGETTELFYSNKEVFLDFGKKLENAIKQGKDFLITEVQLKRKNGELFLSEITITILKEKGEIINAIAIIRDITEQKRLENELKEFPKRLVESQELERKRISSDLHDSLAQNMMVINNEAQRVIKSLSDETGDTKERNSWNLVSSVALQSLSEIKSIAYNLRPNELDQFGLEKTIQSLVERMSRTSGIDIYEKINLGSNTLPSDLEIHIYRIIQEGLNNVVKHSLASEATIEVNDFKDSLNIRISDDGRGLQKHSKHGRDTIKRGLGLQGIEERARIFGGFLKIESAPGKGTALKVSIPLK